MNSLNPIFLKMMRKYLDTRVDFDSPKFAELLDELPLWAAPFGLKLLENIKIKRNSTILDIGFGAGFPLTELAMRFGKSSKIYGIDPWEVLIKRTEKKIAYYGIDNIEIIRGVAENIPLADGLIDLVTSNNGLNNVSDLDKSLSECSRIMKTGGQFIQTLNLDTTMIEFYNVLQDVLEQLGMTEELVAMKHQIYKKRKPLDELIRLIEKHDFTVQNVVHDKFDYTFADAEAMFEHYFIRIAFLGGWKSIVPIDRQLEIFEAIELNINKIAEQEGCFRLSVPFVVIDSVKN